MSKKICIHRERPILNKRDGQERFTNENDGRQHPSGVPDVRMTCQRRHVYIKRDIFQSKETCKRDLRTIQTHLSNLDYASLVKRDLCMSKETCVCQKRPVYVTRDLCMSKETCVCQKRPVYVTRDLCMSQETWMYHKDTNIKQNESIRKTHHQSRQNCYKTVTKLLQNCYKTVTKLQNCSYRECDSTDRARLEEDATMTP